MSFFLFCMPIMPSECIKFDFYNHVIFYEWKDYQGNPAFLCSNCCSIIMKIFHVASHEDKYMNCYAAGFSCALFS